MFDLKRLLQYEFFPAELPPCFSSDDLAANAQHAIQVASKLHRDYSIPLIYSGYKSETARRKFAVPNPYHYCKAVDCIVQQEPVLKPIFEKSPYSLTAPVDRVPKDRQPYAKRSSSIAETKREIELLYQDNRYEIRLDINSFFDNIYTHTIPWAIHGISAAKKKKNDRMLPGNQVDKHIRSMNYDQTNGILVGNALSRIVSEIILCTIDSQIHDQFPDVSCCRFVDDYCIYTKRSAQVQEIIAFIRRCLSKDELNFNESKLQINESPFLYGKPWVEQIKQYIHLQPDVFLSKLIMEYNTYKDIAIIKYGLTVIAQCRYTRAVWPAMQSRLINLWVRFPSLSDRILPIFWKNKLLLKMRSFKAAVYSVIDEALLLNREQELIWAVWFTKVFNIQVSQAYMIRVLQSSNDLAVIMMLDIICSSDAKKNSKILQQRRNLRDELIAEDTDDRGETNTMMWTSHWLLAYEATRMKWLNLPNEEPFEFARKNAFFRELLQKDVKFYDPQFAYTEPSPYTKNYEYATRTELYTSLSKLKKLIAERLKGESADAQTKFTEEEEALYEKFAGILEENEFVY